VLSDGPAELLLDIDSEDTDLSQDDLTVALPVRSE
jgi:hypothetical protein